jgi:hypothetical protein
LSGNSDGTLLRQRIEIENVEINVFLKLLMIVIHRFGSPVGKKYLVRLKELAEGKTNGFFS